MDVEKLRHRKPERTVAGVIVAQLSQADFGRRMRGLARGLWAGEIDLFGFIDAFLMAMERGFEQAWREGARTCGIEPGERSSEEATRLNEYIFAQAPFITPLAYWIQENSRANKVKLAVINNRIQIWENRYNEVLAIAQQMACADSKLRWRRNPMKESCVDCINLDGRVYRASIWAAYDIRPQSRALACGGYRCGCVLEQTDMPATPGRPPGITGL